MSYAGEVSNLASVASPGGSLEPNSAVDHSSVRVV
jgi:hypothetical protein